MAASKVETKFRDGREVPVVKTQPGGIVLEDGECEMISQEDCRSQSKAARRTSSARFVTPLSRRLYC
jgi:hypothetical protein